MSSRGLEIVPGAVNMDTPGLLDAIRTRVITPRPDCMLWPDPSHQGYGRLLIGGSEKRIHRVVWELAHGPIPEGMTIDHLCRVRSCCNTDHMEIVTRAENARRGISPTLFSLLWRRGLGAATHCKRGHEFTPENARIRPGGARGCKRCNVDGNRRRRREQREREQLAS